MGNGYSLRCILFFYQFVNGLGELYPELFEGGGEVSTFASNFAKKWGNYQSIIELAGGDITKFEEVTSYPLEMCLLYLSYKADKSTLEHLLHKEALKKSS